MAHRAGYRDTLGKPNCPHCKGYGYVNTTPEVREINGKPREFPRVVPCECRGGAPVNPVPEAPIVTDEMKLDAQSRAAGETAD